MKLRHVAKQLRDENHAGSIPSRKRVFPIKRSSQSRGNEFKILFHSTALNILKSTFDVWKFETRNENQISINDFITLLLRGTLDQF